MLRRRILASAMASVMAIGSVAVVASAEETAAATAQVKTKADLEAFVKSFDSFRNKEINDYGSISSENFLDAVEYAENVINASDSTVDDYTAAYQMLAAVYGQMKIYTAEELSALIKANKSKYDSNNVYNEDLGDTIYKNEDGKNQWDKFVTAYEDADAVQNSKDSRIISDAYETLKATSDNLSLMTTVTKAQYRAALKTYEQLKQKIYTYDTWRRGYITSDWTNLTSGNFWKYTGAGVTFGGLYSYFVSLEDGADGIYQAYEELDGYKSVNKTSLAEIVNGYAKVCDAIEVIPTWTADDTSRASKASVKSLINEYRGRLAFDFAPATAEALYASIKAAVPGLKVAVDGTYVAADKAANIWTTETAEVQRAHRERGDLGQDDNGNWHVNFNENWMNPSQDYYTAEPFTYLVDASIDVMPDYVYDADGKKAATQGATSFYIPVDANGLWTGDAVITDAKAKYTNDTIKSWKLVSRNSKVDLTDYVAVEDAVVSGNHLHELAAESASKTTPTKDLVSKAGTDAATVKNAANAAAETVKAMNKGEDAASVALKDNAEGLAAWKKYIAANASAINAAIEDIGIYASAVKNSTAAGATESAAKSLKTAADALTALLTGKEAQAVLTAAGANSTDVQAVLDTIAKAANVADLEKTAEYLAAAQKADVAYQNAQIRDTSVDNYFRNEFADGWQLDWQGNAQGEFVGARWSGIQITRYIDLGTNQLENKVVDLSYAMALANLYISENKDAIKANTNYLYELNTTDEIAEGTAKGSAAEWAIVYRYLKYALSDKYDVTVGKYTKADVIDLLEKSYDLAEKTGDAALFEYNHNQLVDSRKIASDWVASANKDKKYKDGKAVDGSTATDIYNDLKGKFDALQSDYNMFKYSFEEIYKNLAVYAEMIDENELEANDTLKAALADTAYALSVVEDLDDELSTAINDEAFTTDRFFQGFNRVYTSTDDSGSYKLKTGPATEAYIEIPAAKSGSATLSHWNLMKAYEALQAEVKRQTEKTVLLGDVNGDGVVNALDASAILKAVVNNTVIETAVGDYNTDGAVNALDASAILKFVVSQS